MLAPIRMLIVRDLDPIRERERHRSDRRSRRAAIAAFGSLALVWWGALGFPLPGRASDATTRSLLERARQGQPEDPEAFAAQLSAAALRSPNEPGLVPELERMVDYALAGNDVRRRRVALYLYPGCSVTGLRGAAERLLAKLSSPEQPRAGADVAAGRATEPRPARRGGDAVSVDDAYFENANAVLMLY